MSKYIDAEKLIAEIERFKATEYGDNTFGDDVANGALDYVLEEIIPSLQQKQPEVDLEKEYKEYVEDDPVFSKLTNRNVGLAIARHFWNKGYNARDKK